MHRPIPTKEEKLIEMHREIHARIYKNYRQEICKKDGEQKSNLTEEQQAGLESLRKRIQEGEIVKVASYVCPQEMNMSRWE